MPFVSCSLCGEEDHFEKLWAVQDHHWVLNSRFVLGRCKKCGLLYLNPRPSPKDLEPHYPPGYYGPPSNEPPPSFFWRLSQIEKYKKGGKILDIGCSSGAFLGFLKAKGWDVYGLDNSAFAIKIAAQHLGDRVSLTTLAEASYPLNSFDVVCLFEVLEHVPDTSVHLQEIHRILKPGGILCLSVPNFASWERILFGPWWNGLDAPRHLYQFTPKTLRMFLEAAGFESLEIRSVSAHHIQANKSRINYCQESLRFLLRDRGLYPQRRVLPHPELSETQKRTWWKEGIQLMESLVFYPFWLFSKFTDRDNTLWACARARTT